MAAAVFLVDIIGDLITHGGVKINIDIRFAGLFKA